MVRQTQMPNTSCRSWPAYGRSQCVHGGLTLAEPDQLLIADQVAARVPAYYLDVDGGPLGMPKKVA